MLLDSKLQAIRDSFENERHKAVAAGVDFLTRAGAPSPYSSSHVAGISAAYHQACVEAMQDAVVQAAIKEHAERP